MHSSEFNHENAVKNKRADDESFFTILLIDDDMSMIAYLSILLADKGEVIAASSGEAGLDLARSNKPDLILLDVSMEEMDGFEVCKRLKSDSSTAGIPVLFVTAGDDEEMEVKALELGAVDFITKPLRTAIVRARVDTQLALRKSSMQLQQLVHLDGLTKLYNRRFFDSRLETEIARHRRQKMAMAIALIDVDHFKIFNDTLGHQAGDDCLRTIARALAVCTRRPGEVVARFGGEEFVVIIPDCSSESAERYGRWLCERITELQMEHPTSTTRQVTVSVGIASRIPDQRLTAREMVELADRALYQAKDEGRNRCVVG